MTKIEGGIATRLNTFGTQVSTKGQATQVPQVGEQVQQALFGRPKPPVLDASRFPHLAEQLNLLRRYKKKLATMAGDDEGEYRLVLADGTIAMIDEAGQIYVGAGFLEACGGRPEILVGVLAHEIGHRPKRWGQYRTRRQLSREELEILCRHEETRADIFAGKALAEMGMSSEPLGEFLSQIEEKPHPEYFPAKVRAEVIRDAHQGREYRAKARKGMFPQFDRMTAPKGHLGEY